MNLDEAIQTLECAIRNPTEGLPENIFRFVSGVTPLINVDLLIRNEQRQTLLAWREDGIHGNGWHVPGGIVRFRETRGCRVQAVAMNELGAQVTFADTPLAVTEYMHPTRRVRGHFLSFLYDCSLTSPPRANLQFAGGAPRAGQWAWHDRCPADLLGVHEVYRQFIELS